MPWSTPSLRSVRETVRGEITTSLGRASFVSNSVLRVMADAMAALAHLTLRYIDWLALQLMPDTAEREWLDRHGDIWLVNADDTTGRKLGALASGQATVTGVDGIAVPVSSRLTSSDDLQYETTVEVLVTPTGVPVPVRALSYGRDGNRFPGDGLQFVEAISGVDGQAVVIVVDGGANAETDDQLRRRILQRIRNPPMGGSAEDYVRWALACPGVDRAWAEAEQGPGTITVRFLMDPEDPAYEESKGWPTSEDIEEVKVYIDKMRPVTVMDCYVFAPIQQYLSITIADLVTVPDTVAARTAAKTEIEASVERMLFANAAPGQTIYAAWISNAILNAPSVQSFELVTTDDFVMESVGHMAVLETILYDE
jgi:uncharacterized phage protein gp47/JayE